MTAPCGPDGSAAPAEGVGARGSSGDGRGGGPGGGGLHEGGGEDLVLDGDALGGGVGDDDGDGADGVAVDQDGRGPEGGRGERGIRRAAVEEAGGPAVDLGGLAEGRRSTCRQAGGEGWPLGPDP
ncbi:hypothetical protein [Actinomyces denticolens]|uniref:hypothetical protein n=1 Tax=Actinomyces denticolens TaxID=52767 RepID=UPI0009823358|nr:hypothetical protein [Actinomyces denticolens]